MKHMDFEKSQNYVWIWEIRDNDLNFETIMKGGTHDDDYQN